MIRRFLTWVLLAFVLILAPGALSARAVDAAAGDHDAVAAGHAGESHDEHAAHAPAAPELPNLIHSFTQLNIGDHKIADTAFGHFLHAFEKQIFLIIITAFLSWFVFRSLRLRAMKPGKFQMAVEMLVEGLVNFFTGIVGKEHKRHVPFLCSLFVFIWVNNLSALIPGFAPATAKFQTTLALALLVFVYFIGFGIIEGGLGHFLWHLAGSPKDAVGWAISPVMFVLEVVGTLAKPVSLSLRLFGNIMGEDILLGVFLLLGLMLAGAIVPDPIIGVPLHLPFLFLVLLSSTIQALVFSLLSAIYLAMVLPHHDHEHDEAHGDEHPLLPGAEEKNENSGHVDAGVVPFA